MYKYINIVFYKYYLLLVTLIKMVTINNIIQHVRKYIEPHFYHTPIEIANIKASKDLTTTTIRRETAIAEAYNSHTILTAKITAGVSFNLAILNIIEDSAGDCGYHMSDDNEITTAVEEFCNYFENNK